KAPVIYVTWWHAIDFCNWLSRKEGLRVAYTISGRPARWGSLAYKANDWTVEWDKTAPGYRLPTEAEWQFAAQGGNHSSKFDFSGADDPEAVGWWRGNSEGLIHKVAQLQANEVGIFDMSGNAGEWCWNPFFVRGEQSARLHETTQSPIDTRVVRGGSAKGPPRELGYRSHFLPHGSEFVTVRPVRNAD
ncbi:MAG: SUMF1/EgtB/PvdO family nonheme iron enzyme, partial [Spirochaetes bacterium]|nr:SUMF1/EgtB/PvdO family nonheme iron enzyme [Spirochaetota bacterium]